MCNKVPEANFTKIGSYDIDLILVNKKEDKISQKDKALTIIFAFK